MKRKLLTKVVVALLCFAFIMVTPVNMLAEEYRQDETVSVITKDAFQSLFAEKTRSVDNISVESVKYNYNFEIRGKNVAEVEMVAIFSILGRDYPVVLNGTVNGQALENKDIFWEGPIEGIMEINDVEYLVIASFAKLGNTSDNVQICATIQTLDSDNSILPVIIQFGEDVITQEIHAQVCNQIIAENDSDGKKIQINNSSIQNRVLNYLEIGEDETTFAYNGKESQYLCVIDSGASRVTAKVLASPDNINEYYRTFSPGAVTGVSSVTITLSVGENTANSMGHIVGTENYTFGDNYNKVGVALKNLFYDILSFLGVPTATLNEILGDLTGKVEKNYSTIETSVTISSVSDSSIYEEHGLPITFQLGTSLFESVYVGPTNYVMTSSIRYLSMYLPLFSEVYTYSYTNTPKAIVDVPYTLGDI